jgi:hypothetical protein
MGEPGSRRPEKGFMTARSRVICPICGDENLVWASHCRGCQASLEGGERVRAASPFRLPPAVFVGLLLCAVAFALLWSISDAAKAGRTAAGPKTLKVLWHKFYGDYGKEWIVGEVSNQSAHPLTHILAEGEYYGDDGRLLETGSAPLKPDPLGPGQVAHFRIAAPFNQDATKSWFHFQTTSGDQVTFQR